ncbi:MAG: 1-deoxy-D-xylulose-5-phosphate reductoisomerase, partial [Actinomycetota bacterium]
MRDVVILGSTGSIGVQALEVISENPDKFRVVGLASGSNNIERFIEQAKKFQVPVIGTTGDGVSIRAALPKASVI